LAMRLMSSGAIAAIVVLLASAPQAASAQNAEPEKRSGPAPVRDFWGMWSGPNEGLLSNRVPDMTPAGRAKLDANIPDPFSASSNDPWKTCDPFGMPRGVNNQYGLFGFAQMPGRIIILNAFNHIAMTETVDDPAYYSRNPFLLAKQDYRFVRNQTDANTPIPFTSDRLCIPSQAMDYMKAIGLPADIDSATGQKKK